MAYLPYFAIWEANLCIWGPSGMPTLVHASVEDITSLQSVKNFGDGDPPLPSSTKK